MIRKLEKTDFSTLKELFGQLYQIHYYNRPDIFTPNQPINEKYFDEILNSTVKHCFVYEKEGKLIGAILYKEFETENYDSLKPRKFFKIYDIVIKQEFRRQGYGTKLFEFVKEQAKTNDVDSIEVEAWAFNDEAINFYKKLNMKIKKYIFEIKVNT